jgi:hypothetical protein
MSDYSHDLESEPLLAASKDVDEGISSVDSTFVVVLCCLFKKNWCFRNILSRRYGSNNRTSDW